MSDIKIKSNLTLETYCPIILSSRLVCISSSLLGGSEKLVATYKEYLIKVKFVAENSIIELDCNLLKLQARRSLGKVVADFIQENKIEKFDNIYILIRNYQGDLSLSELVSQRNYRVVVSSELSSVAQTLTEQGFEHILINTFSFADYLQRENIKISKENFHLVNAYFDDFLKEISPDELQIVDYIIQKQILAKYNIRERERFYRFFYQLVKHSGVVISINELADLCKIAVDTAARFLEFVLDTQLFTALEKYQPIMKEGRKTAAVFFCNYPGIVSLIKGKISLWQNFFNFIFQQLNGNHIYYFIQEKRLVGLVIDDKILIIPNYKKAKEIRIPEASAFEKVIEVTNVEEVYNLEGKLGRYPVTGAR
ncbi:MAG: hypothetical protein WCJ58_07450 [bacterium]